MTGGTLDTLLTLMVVVGVVGILSTTWVLETMARRPLDGTPVLMESLHQHTVVAGDGHRALCQELCRSQSCVSVVFPLHGIRTPAGARSLDGRRIVRDERVGGVVAPDQAERIVLLERHRQQARGDPSQHGTPVNHVEVDPVMPRPDRWLITFGMSTIGTGRAVQGQPLPLLAHVPSAPTWPLLPRSIIPTT